MCSTASFDNHPRCSVSCLPGYTAHCYCVTCGTYGGTSAGGPSTNSCICVQNSRSSAPSPPPSPPPLPLMTCPLSVAWGSGSVVKEGNNGTVTCNDYCLGSWNGQASEGTCISARTTSGRDISCFQYGAGSVVCTCRRSLDGIMRQPGNNGTVSCTTYCSRGYNGFPGGRTCSGGYISGGGIRGCSVGCDWSGNIQGGDLICLCRPAPTIGVTAAPTTVQVQSPVVSMVSSSLLRFEGALSLAAVSPNWRGRRAAWVGATSNARTPEVLARQIIALESAITWSAVEPSWRQARPGWVAQAHTVATAHDAAQVLLALENTVRWESVDPSWRIDRTAWVSALRSVAGP